MTDEICYQTAHAYEYGQITNNKNGGELRYLILEEYCEKNSNRPDVLKIKVEGFEYEVLEGAERILSGYSPSYLSIEIHKSGLSDYGPSVLV